MAEVSTEAIDGQFGGQTETSDPVLQADIFDQAKEHYFSGRPPEEASNDLGESENQLDQNTEETEPAEENQETSETEQNTEETSEFKPYAFKGNVFGKEVEQSFDSPEDLNRTIAKGLASDTLYKKLKERDNHIQELKSRAESGDELEAMAKESPRDLVEMIFDKYMSKETVAEYVLEKFEYFRELSRLSPEERANREKLELADKLLKDKRLADEAAKKAEAQQQELVLKRELEDEKNWANLELRRAVARFDKLEQGIIRDQILGVIAQARLAKQQGSPMTQKQMSSKLAQFLKPFERLASPGEARKRLGKAVDQKKQEATTVVQNAARGQATGGGGSAGNANPPEQGDIFDMIAKQVSSGKLKLRS